MSMINERRGAVTAALVLGALACNGEVTSEVVIGRGAQALSVAAKADAPPAAPARPLVAAAHGRRDGSLSPLAEHARELLSQPITSKARLTLVFVFDGLRPDLINETDTPNLHRLRQEGVNFINGHAVFPTVTRVNSPSIATGCYPARAGIVGNSIFIPELDPIAQVNTGDWNVLRDLDRTSQGRLLLVPSLAERLHAAGKTLAAVSSGSSGSAFLLNHRAPAGVGVLVNGYLAEPDGRVAYPDAVNAAILQRFGAAPPTGGEGELVAAVDWAEEVLREYILPAERPDVVLNWLTQPDGAHHTYGTGSPEGTLAIQNDDRNIGLILAKLRELDLFDATNIFFVSDHGFGLDTHEVNVAESLVQAGLKAAPDADDVVLASSSQAVSIHVKDRDPARIRAIVEHLQLQTWAGALFTARTDGADGEWFEGAIPGTFSLELVHLDNPERGADIVLTYDWSSGENAFGVPGTDMTTGATTSARTGNASGHGSMSPWNVRNTWFAWGADFKDGVVNRVPASNVDIAPTILALHGLDPSELDGRILREALDDGPDYEKLPLDTRSFATVAPDTDYRAAIQITRVAHQRYVDKSWRF